VQCNSRGCAASQEVLSAARVLKRVRWASSAATSSSRATEHGVGGLSTVELLVRHPVQLLGREMHVLMDVLVLLGRRQAEVLHQQLQRLQLVGPPGLNTRLLREYVEIGVGNYGRGLELILRFSSSSAAGMSSCIFTGPGRRASH